MNPTSKVKQVLALSTNELTDLASVLSLPADHQSTLQSALELTLTEAQWGSVPIIRDATAYVGFDPRKIAIKVAELASRNPSTGEAPEEITTEGGATLMIHRNCHLPTDLLFLITVFLERGNNVQKILGKTQANVAAVISRKAAQYGIELSASGTRRTDTVTLSRLAQTFPQITVSAILGHDIPGKLKPRFLIDGVELPNLMKHTIYSAVIPEDEPYTSELKTIAVALNIEMSYLLSTPKDKRKMDHKEMEELTSQSEKFVQAAMSSVTMNKAVKIKVCRKAGLLNATGITPTVAAIAGICTVFLSQPDSSLSSSIRRCRQSQNAAIAPAIQIPPGN